MSTHSPARITDVLDELQISLVQGSLARRVNLLRRVTDLFLHGATDYTEEHLAVFDDVFKCLVTHMHDEAQILLAQRLAPVPTAPRKIIRHLALHDLIEVASPVLAQSECIDDETLIDVARHKGQEHLLAISSRPMLSTGVTDVLLDRGNAEVVGAVVHNPKAELSDLGYDVLASRSDHADWIATCVQMRPTMPRHHYLRLVAKASDSVRATLQANFPKAADAIAKTIAEVAQKARNGPAAYNEATAISHELVGLLYEDGRLNDKQVAQFADEGQFDEVCAALACLAKIPVSLAEAMMIEAQAEGLFILGKVCDLSWPTVRAILLMRTKLGHQPSGDLDEGREVYLRLRGTTAHQVLRFHRMQLSVAHI